MTKILITGADGQLGYELARTCLALGEVCAMSRANFDLSNREQMQSVLQSFRPNIILNAAAYTAVDKAETDDDMNQLVNAKALAFLGAQASQMNACIIHYSTDYVFSGTAQNPYRETDATGPVSAYGKAKLEGEKNLLESGAPHLIFRTSWVYGARGKNFLLTMLKLAREREELGVVADQVGSPTWVRAIAEATAHVLAQARGNYNEYIKLHQGIYHLTCGGQTTWYDFAAAIFNNDPKKAEQVLKTLKAIRTEDYKTPAKRPAFSVLDNGLFEKTFGLKMPQWEDALKLALK